MKKLLCILGFLLLILCLPVTVNAAEFGSSSTAAEPPAQEDYLNQQTRQSGAGDLPDAIPPEARESLDSLGIGGMDWQQITSLTPESLFGELGNAARENASKPMRAAVSVLAVMVLCALCGSMKLSFGDIPLSGVLGMTGALCVCTTVVQPLVVCVENAARAVDAAAGFLLACIPVLAGIMTAAGQPASAASFQLLMVGAGNAVSLISAQLLVPFLNIYLAISIVSAVSPAIDLSGLCSAFDKIVKWVLGLSMTLFSGLLTMHTIVAASVDTTSARAARFMVSSFVPVVGGALGEALHTISGCVKMLKSGVSAFILLAGLVMFLPVILQCLIWMASLTVCAGIGDVFALKEITGLLRAACRVIQTMLAIVLCCMAVLTVSTAVMLIIGGAGAS